MKNTFIFFIVSLLVLALANMLHAQSIRFSDWVDPRLQDQSSSMKMSTLTTTTYHDVVVIATDSGASTLLPTWFNDLMGGTKLHDFFYASTFGNFNYDFYLLKAYETHAFEMPTPYTPPFDGTCQHVHLESNVLAVLQAADNIYNYRDYDFDGDGKVYIHFASIGPKSGGVGSQCFSYTSQDTMPNGSHIIVYVARQTRGSGSEVFESVFYHEGGHSFFGFPDMNHAGSDDYNHYGIGAFDVMSGGGFQGQPSPYNPASRHMKGWFNPIQITSSQNGAVLQDFQMNSQCYVYIPSSLPSNALSNERFYISYHKWDPDHNALYSKYPFADPLKGGVLIWHTNVNNIEWANFSDRRKLPIDIECAHGKTIWNETSDNVINTGVPDPLTGFDKLEIRKVVNGHEIAGPYYGVDHGDGTIFYTPDDGKNFTFYTNPNSNWYYNSEPYSQSITSGFSVKNIRTESGLVKADFVVYDYTVTENCTLTKGSWYFYNDLIVNNGVMLTIEPGSTIYFANGKSLIVNGTLNAQGTSTNNITFTSTSGTWSGIRFNSGSSGTLSYCTIQNAQYGIYCNGYLPNITNCTIQNNYIGINLYNTGVQTNNIANNTIQNNTTYGINMTYSSPRNIYGNDIYRNGQAGMYCSSNSIPYIYNNEITDNGAAGITFALYSSGQLGNSGSGGYNLITGNTWGVGCGYESDVIIGTTSQCGYNSIHDNSNYEVTGE